MLIEYPDYTPIEIIFHLLCVCRWIESRSSRTLRRAMQRRGLATDDLRQLPSLPFWLHLCQSADLLDDGLPPRPTLLVDDWLALPLGEQLAALVQAWQRMSAAPRLQELRQKVLERLAEGADLDPTYIRELYGLQALGLCEDLRLTLLGRAVLEGRYQDISAPTPPAWRIEGDLLQIPFPPVWSWQWELEKYIDPLGPGLYPLTDSALRLAVQRGGGAQLSGLIERGLGVRLEVERLQDLTARPVIRILPGPVLEFNDPQTLLDLRKTASLRRALEGVLSPRHVALDPNRAEGILRRLQRKGWLSEADILAYTPAEPVLSMIKPGFSLADRAYLLALLLLIEGLNGRSQQDGSDTRPAIVFAPPPGLPSRLAVGMRRSLRAAAARKANAALARLEPLPKWVPEEEPPPLPDESLLDALQQAIVKQEAIDVLYQASGRRTPEYRHLTPLMVEARGGRYYLIAYCHTRRANRTFRLDQLRVIG